MLEKPPLPKGTSVKAPISRRDGRGRGVFGLVSRGKGGFLPGFGLYTVSLGGKKCYFMLFLAFFGVKNGLQ